MAAGLPSSVVTEIEFTAGVWTDVSADVKAESIEISQAKQSPSGELEPGTLDLDLDNSAGAWTPDNPLAASFPNFVEGKRIRQKVTKSATTYLRFVGRIVTIKPDFPDDITNSTTHVTAVDALGDLARMDAPLELQAILRAIYLAQSGGNTSFQSAFYWPLRDGHRLVDTVTGFRTLSYFQPTVGGEATWENDSSFPLDGQSCLTLTAGVGLQFTLPFVGSADPQGPGLAFKIDSDGVAGAVVTCGSGRPSSASFNGYAVWWDGTSVLSLRSYAAGVPTTVVSATVSPGWHFTFMDGAGGWILDGATVAALVGGTAQQTIYVGGSLALSVRDLYIGDNTVRDLASYLVDTGASLSTITSQIATQLSLSSLQASLAWTSSVAGIKAVPLPLEGKPAIDAVTALANSQSGHAWVAYATADPQPITLLANADSRSATVALTLDADADLIGGPTFDRNVYGKVSTATGKNPFTSVLVTDDTLLAKFGSSSDDVMTALASANQLAAAASDRISQSKSAKLRISEVTFDLALAVNDLYAQFMALKPGGRVRVTNLLATYIGVTQLDGIALGWKERPSIFGYPVTLYLLSADAPPEAKYDDATRGRYGWADGAATVTGGTAVGTTANGTLVITTPSGPCLTTNAAMYPMDLDWNGESVTITSAPASSTSPQTVTTTARGANGTAARSHAAGEAVDVWRSARFAL